MSKSPPGVQRVVAGLNFFAEHPGQSFTFTDILKALDLGRATCHSLLVGLVEAQYLYRNIDKTYVIGPALAAIGRISSREFSPKLAAQPELRALSDEYRAVATVARLEGADAVIELRAGSGRLRSWSASPGQRYPQRAPFAGSFFVTAKSYEIERWLDSLIPSPREEEKQDFYAGMEFVRQHGYMFGEYNAGVEYDTSDPVLPFTGQKDAYPVKVCRQLELQSQYQLAFITSPVIGHDDNVEFIIILSAFRNARSGMAVAETGAQLRAAAERLSAFITGDSAAYPLPR